MGEELSKIEKPLVENYREKRKLYFVPLLFTPKELPDDFKELIDRYWEQVQAQLVNLEEKMGKVNAVFHELVAAGGEEGVESIEQLNPSSYKLAKSIVDGGAELCALEDPEILTEFMDWMKCLTIGLQNKSVMDRVFEFYTESFNKRNNHIAVKIDETLKEKQTGILFMREGHNIQFSGDIELFYVSPPGLDEIKRWMRQQESKGPDPAEQNKGSFSN
ncbi:MAG: hypothetical protein Q8P44_01425 [Dehalococcoidia bacterium]|nr:hypothetical protein [Dehalococcoidia bacterium]